MPRSAGSDVTVREAAARVRDPMITALLTLVVQGALYFVTVRDDVRDLKAEMRAVKCEVSVGFKRAILPDGCNLNSALLRDAASGVQQAGAPAAIGQVTP